MWEKNRCVWGGVDKKHCFLLMGGLAFPDPPASISWVPEGQAGTPTPGGELANRRVKWDGKRDCRQV